MVATFVHMPAEETGPEAPAPSPAATEDRPEWLPENFKTPEDMAKSYTEAQSEMGRLRARIAEMEKGGAPAADKAADQSTPDSLKIEKEAPATEAADDDDKAADDAPADDAAEKAVEAAGLNMDDLAKQYEETGKLADESYEAFEKIGISKDYVDTYLNNLGAAQELAVLKAQNAVGGAEAANKMIQWAGKAFTDAEVKVFNDQIDSGQMDTVVAAMTNLKARYESAMGSAPEVEVSGDSARGGGEGYTSKDQMKADMSDPRYKTDESFRAAVAAKLARSSIL